MRLEYDERKNRQNLAKHGVDFETAEIVFDDPYALTQRDEIHDQEGRFITLGEIAPGVVLFVVHTAFAARDGEEVIRLISARAATISRTNCECCRTVFRDSVSSYQPF